VLGAFKKGHLLILLISSPPNTLFLNEKKSSSDSRRISQIIGIYDEEKKRLSLSLSLTQTLIHNFFDE
jgi:hypothetical protein